MESAIIRWTDANAVVTSITDRQCRESGITLYKVVRWPGYTTAGWSLTRDPSCSRKYIIGKLITAVWPFFCFAVYEDALAYLRIQQQYYPRENFYILECQAFNVMEGPGWAYVEQDTKYWGEYHKALRQPDKSHIEALPKRGIQTPEGTVFSHGLVPLKIV